MADVSFLLLLFFIITSTFDMDSGISLSLPKYTHKKESVEINKDRVLIFFIDVNNNVYINSNKSTFENVTNVVRNKIVSFIDKPDNEKLVISLDYDSRAKYEYYIKLMDNIKLAFAIEREILSKKIYKKSYKDLNSSENQEIRKKIPFILNFKYD